MTSPGLGEGPAGPDCTTLYCRPDASVFTPGACALFAMKAAALGWAPAAGGGDGWAKATPAEQARAAAAIRRCLMKCPGKRWAPPIHAASRVPPPGPAATRETRRAATG